MKCKICETGHLEFHSDAKDYWVTGEEFRLLKCNQCEVVCTEVEVTDGFFDKYYEQTYYAHEHKFLKFGLRERLQINRVKIQRGERLGFFDSLVNRIVAGQVLVDIPAIENGRILDVGCGAGKLLRVAASVGYECHGVEPSVQARGILEESGFKAYGSMIDTDFPKKYFDVIVFNQSLEHMPDPVAAINKAIESLKDDGVLIVSVPNFASNERLIFGNYWRHVDVPRHLFHFSPSTLQYIAENNNLLVKKKRFKFWGRPDSAFRLEKKERGVRAYRDLMLWVMRQAFSLLRIDRSGYGQMMSYHYCKSGSVVPRGDGG